MDGSEFWRDKHVVVTGGAGFLGSRIVEALRRRGAGAITVPRSAEYDLRSEQRVVALFDTVLEQSRPEDVLLIHAAARVGGIAANLRQPASFYYDNLLMGTRLMHEAAQRGVGKFVGIGTVCAYPKHTPIPFTEDDLWNGYPEESNAPYGLAKKMLLVQGNAYRLQYGFNAIFLLPTNLYGPGDNFDPDDSHVIPALIRKCVEAVRHGASSIEAWGTGTATRDYLYVDDAAEGIVLAAERYDGAEPVNVSSDAPEVSMRELVPKIALLTGFEGLIVWDSSRPDGQPRRKVDGRRARELIGFEARVALDEGLRRTIDWYRQQV